MTTKHFLTRYNRATTSKEDIMKKLILVFLMAIFSVPSFANGRDWNRGGGHRGGGHHNEWIAPLVLGAGIVYLVSRQQQQVQTVEELSPPLPCSVVEQRVTDSRGRPLFSQYTGQPLTRWVQVCPQPPQLRREY